MESITHVEWQGDLELAKWDDFHVQVMARDAPFARQFHQMR